MVNIFYLKSSSVKDCLRAKLFLPFPKNVKKELHWAIYPHNPLFSWEAAAVRQRVLLARAPLFSLGKELASSPSSLCHRKKKIRIQASYHMNLHFIHMLQVKPFLSVNLGQCWNSRTKRAKSKWKMLHSFYMNCPCFWGQFHTWEGVFFRLETTLIWKRFSTQQSTTFCSLQSSAHLTWCSSC